MAGKNFPKISVNPDDGALIQNAGRYARESVLIAFEQIGGVDRMAAWADENPGEFFTKLFPKTITKEVEHGASQSLEDMIESLDSNPGDDAIDVTPSEGGGE